MPTNLFNKTSVYPGPGYSWEKVPYGLNPDPYRDVIVRFEGHEIGRARDHAEAASIENKHSRALNLILGRK